MVLLFTGILQSDCEILYSALLMTVSNNGLFDLAARAGLETQSIYILHTEHKKI